MAIQRRLSNKFWISDIWKSIKRLWIFEKKSKIDFEEKSLYNENDQRINQILKILQGRPPLSFSGVFFRRMNPTDNLILYKNDEFSFILWDFSDFFQNYFRYFSKIQSRFIDFQMSLIQKLFDKRRWIAICTTKYKPTTERWASELLWAPRYSSVKFPNIVTMSKSSRIKMKTMIHITNFTNWYVS